MYVLLLPHFFNLVFLVLSEHFPFLLCCLFLIVGNMCTIRTNNFTPFDCICPWWASHSCRTLWLPMLKWETASKKPSSSMSLPSYTSFGIFRQTKPLKFLSWFWAFPCRHFHTSPSSLNFWWNGSTLAMISKGRPAPCLCILRPASSDTSCFWTGRWTNNI